MAAIYATVDDIFDAVEDALHVKDIGDYRTTSFYRWLDEIMVEWQRINPTYEPLRTEGTITLTAGTSAYAFSTINSACLFVDVQSFRTTGDKIIYRPEDVIRSWDRAWTETGSISTFTVHPSSIKFWPIPNAAFVASYSTVYLDYFTRLEKLSTEAGALTQFPEWDRVLLVKGMEWRGLKEQDDPEWQTMYKLWIEGVERAGGDASLRARGIRYQIGLGPYFDSDLDEDF